MDNNIIEEVCGLEMLTRLEWLDLSFNNIEEISGLEKLVNLRDLSLANNRLKTISNLDSLMGSLQILSVANNLIEDKKNVRLLCSRSLENGYNEGRVHRLNMSQISGLICAVDNSPLSFERKPTQLEPGSEFFL